ncbi:MAG TPA: hypothetical protein VJI98_03270 [Candidatus Nanoarchaeia archaeon]|nr:hypothetical protein [Candidatus Nanoarchaeia archaeon]
MATILDVGILNYFDFIFPWILVFALVFGLLQKTKFITDSIHINAAVSAVLAFMVILSDAAVKIINVMIPWLAVTVIFLTLLLLIFQLLGLQEKDLPKLVADKAVYWPVLVIGIIIIIASFGTVFGQSLTEASLEGGIAIEEGQSTATGDFRTNIYAILFNTKVLGIMVLFTVAIFAVFLLSGT